MHYFSSYIPLEEGDDPVDTLRRRRPQDVRIDEADEVGRCKRIDRDTRVTIRLFAKDEARQERIRRYQFCAERGLPMQ